MRTHPHLVPRRYPGDAEYCNEILVGEASPMDIPPIGGVPSRVTIATPGGGSGGKKHKRSGSTKAKHHHQQSQHQQLQLQRSFSSSDDELRSTPECGSCDERDSEKGESGWLRTLWNWTWIINRLITLTKNFWKTSATDTTWRILRDRSSYVFEMPQHILHSSHL